MLINLGSMLLFFLSQEKEMKRKMGLTKHLFSPQRPSVIRIRLLHPTSSCCSESTEQRTTAGQGEFDSVHQIVLVPIIGVINTVFPKC